MSYTEGALEVKRGILIRALIEQFGPMDKGNSQFTVRNLWDSFGDKSYYALEEHRAKQYISDTIEILPWIAEVCDCDSRTICFAADCIKRARRMQWERAMALADLWYVSKSLGLPHVNRMDGYHSAPIILVKTADRDLKYKVVQPPTLYENTGTEVEAKWQEPKEEVKFWVFANALG